MGNRKIKILILLKPLYLMLTTIIKKSYGIHISDLAEIAPGFCIGHFT